MSDTCLVKTIHANAGMTDGFRQRKWSENIVDWCNCSLTEAVQLTEGRQAWEKPIAVITGLNARMGYEHEEEE